MKNRNDMNDSGLTDDILEEKVFKETVFKETTVKEDVTKENLVKENPYIANILKGNTLNESCSLNSNSVDGMFEINRDDFPGLSAELDGTLITYLDSAATSLKPKAVVNAICEYYTGISSNVHRGKYYSLESVSNRYEEARSKVADLISCSSNEIVFVRNTTEAINTVASGLELEKDDLVILFSDSHHSNILPWMDKANVKYVRLDSKGNLDLDHYFELLKLRPAVVAVTHCSNVTGIYVQLEIIVSAAKDCGAIVVVDAAQSIPHRKINVTKLGVDFLAFSCHKMLGPTGVGVLFGTRNKLEKLKPTNLGGGMVDWVDYSSYRLRKIPHRFEAGTPNISGSYGTSAAIDYMNAIGFDNIEKHDKEMGRFMLQEASKRDYLQPINCDPEADRGGIISLSIPGLDNLDDIARVLSDSYGIMCRNGHMCAQPYIDANSSGQVLRASSYLYNTKEDVLNFFKALDETTSYMLY